MNKLAIFICSHCKPYTNILMGWQLCFCPKHNKLITKLPFFKFLNSLIIIFLIEKKKNYLIFAFVSYKMYQLFKRISFYKLFIQDI